MTTNIRPK